MKRTTLLLLTSLLAIASVSVLALRTVHATASSAIRVERVDHVVVPVYGGLLLINDTVRISPTTENTTIEKFSIGFPLKYRANLVYSTAYDTKSPRDEIGLILDTGLGATGYYGVTVVFPDEARNSLYRGESYTFTVVFILSDLITSTPTIVNETQEYKFTADFPAYPSLPQEVSICNVTVILPQTTEYVPNDFPFNATTKDQRYYLNYTTTVPRLSQASTQVSFISENRDTYTCFSINKSTQGISIDANGDIHISETYLIKSKTAFQVDIIQLTLPRGATDISALDEQEKKVTSNLVDNQTNAHAFSLTLLEGQSRSLRINYNLQRENHLAKLDSQSFELKLDMFENLQNVLKTSTVRITFPEGATIQAFPQQTFNVQRQVFQESLSLSVSNFTWLQDKQWTFSYSYPILWSSFRPTIWATSLVIVGSIIAFAWQRPKAPITVSVVLVPRKTLNEFVETYEEKKRVLSELEQTKQKALKGKVSRRRYKIRKTTLENRLSALSKKIADLRQKITSGGAKYADIMRNLEVAEIELDNIEADLKRIEVRFKRGEISAQTYRRLLEDDLRRREKAKTTIDGVLLRLRE